MTMEGEDIRRYSLDTLQKTRERSENSGRSADVQPIDPAFWETARVVEPPGHKQSVHLRLDSDVLDWFRGQGRGHLSRMNAVLRSFMEAQKSSSSR